MAVFHKLCRIAQFSRAHTRSTAPTAQRSLCETWRILRRGSTSLYSLKFYLDRVVRHQPFLASEN